MISPFLTVRSVRAQALILFAVAGVTGCEKSTVSLKPSPMTSNGPSEAQAFAKLDACSLITKEEIENTQGSPVTDAKSSEKTDGVFNTSQCYYTTTEANRSVSLVVTRSLGSGQRSPKEFWTERFGPYEKGLAQEAEETAESRERSGEKEQEHEAAPKKIEGVGDSAYWTGDRIGGALYVLKRDAFIRVSIGGRDSEEGKISKSKALAEKALSRF